MGEDSRLQSRTGTFYRRFILVPRRRILLLPNTHTAVTSESIVIGCVMTADKLNYSSLVGEGSVERVGNDRGRLD